MHEGVVTHLPLLREAQHWDHLRFLWRKWNGNEADALRGYTAHEVLFKPAFWTWFTARPLYLANTGLIGNNLRYRTTQAAALPRYHYDLPANRESVAQLDALCRKHVIPESVIVHDVENPDEMAFWMWTNNTLLPLHTAVLRCMHCNEFPYFMHAGGKCLFDSSTFTQSPAMDIVKYDVDTGRFSRWH